MRKTRRSFLKKLVGGSALASTALVMPEQADAIFGRRRRADCSPSPDCGPLCSSLQHSSYTSINGLYLGFPNVYGASNLGSTPNNFLPIYGNGRFYTWGVTYPYGSPPIWYPTTAIQLYDLNNNPIGVPSPNLNPTPTQMNNWWAYSFTGVPQGITFTLRFTINNAPMTPPIFCQLNLIN